MGREQTRVSQRPEPPPLELQVSRVLDAAHSITPIGRNVLMGPRGHPLA
jgi:hypothetical protein